MGVSDLQRMKWLLSSSARFAREFADLAKDNESAGRLPSVVKAGVFLRQLLSELDESAATCGADIDNLVYSTCEHEWKRDWYDVMSGEEDHSVMRVTCKACGMLKRD